MTFRYGAAAEPVIRELDLLVPEGDHLAIVGPSGVGKSTLASVMAGLLRPQAGSVLMRDVPVEGLDRSTLARERVLIPQEAYVFAGTVAENLSYLTAGASHDDLRDVIERLGMSALIEKLGGFDAELGPGMLSAGERQLITLARSYLSPARLTILDEATCHLDPATEARVEHAFAQRDGTLVVIAHRISSARRAKRILVMDGRRSTLGQHESLLSRSSLYRDLVGRWEAGASHRDLEPRRPVRP